MDSIRNEEKCEASGLGASSGGSSSPSDRPGGHRFEPGERDGGPDTTENRSSMKRLRHLVNLRLGIGPYPDSIDPIRTRQ